MTEKKRIVLDIDGSLLTGDEWLPGSLPLLQLLAEDRSVQTIIWTIANRSAREFRELIAYSDIPQQQKNTIAASIREYYSRGVARPTLDQIRRFNSGISEENLKLAMQLASRRLDIKIPLLVNAGAIFDDDQILRELAPVFGFTWVDATRPRDSRRWDAIKEHQWAQRTKQMLCGNRPKANNERITQVVTKIIKQYA